MYQQATPTLFSVHLIDRSRNCACDCKTIQHKHSLIRICSKEARTQTSSPTSSRTPLADSFCGQTIVASGNQLYQTTSAPGIQRCSSPSSAFPEEKVAYAPWDSTTRGVPISDLHSSYLPVSPHFSVEEDLIQPETASPLNTSSLGTSKPFRQRCHGLLKRVKEKMRLPVRVSHCRRSSNPHLPVEMDGQASGIHELAVSYDDGRSYRSHVNDQLASQSYGCDIAMPDLCGVGSFAELPADQNIFQFGNFNNTRVLGDAGGLFLGGANDFPSSAGPYELPVSPNQDGTLTVPTENFQPQLNFVTPTQTLDFSQPNAVSNPTHLFSRGNGPRSPNLPTLTLQTENIQGRNISYPSSRRLSWQSSISSSVHSQVTGTTPSSGTRFTPFSSTQSSFGTPSSFYPPTGLTPSSAYLDRNKNGRSPDTVHFRRRNDSVVTPESATMRDLGRLEGLFADSHPILSPTINDSIQFAPTRSPFSQSTQADQLGLVPRPLNPHGSQPSAPPALPTQPHPPRPQHQWLPDQPNAPPPRVLEPVSSPRPQASCDNRCPRCHRLFTSKPRDVSRNIRRHLEFACSKREAFAPRLSCSVPGCRKTFVRDCAKRVHEEKQHGILRSSRRGRGAVESLSMRRALSAA